MAGNFAASDGKRKGVSEAFARHDNLNDRAFGAFEQVRDFAGGQSVSRFFVDLDDHIAGSQSGIVSGRADVWRHDYSMIFARRDDHSHAVILAALIFTQ